MLKAIPKVKTVRDKKYLAFIRKQSCCVCGKTSGIVPHHSSTGGMGIKGSDLEAVPVCAFPCHALVHAESKGAIQNLPQVINNLHQKYIKEMGREIE